MIYKTFEQWKSGNVLEHGVPRTEHYTEDQLDLVEMGWKYGYDAGRAVEQALDKKAENARELGLDYEPAPVQSCYCPNCEAMGKELAALKAQPAPVQEPIGYLFQHEETGLTTVVDVQQVEWGFEKNNPRHQNIGPVYTTPPAQPAPVQPVATVQCINGVTIGYLDVMQPVGTKLYTTPPAAQPAPVQPIIGSYLEKDNSQFKFSDYESDGVHHNKPAVPDAFGTREGEHPQYIEGWNDCRAEMLKGMKP
jgi:hypothetical protein